MTSVATAQTAKADKDHGDIVGNRGQRARHTESAAKCAWARRLEERQRHGLWEKLHAPGKNSWERTELFLDDRRTREHEGEYAGAEGGAGGGGDRQDQRDQRRAGSGNHRREGG